MSIAVVIVTYNSEKTITACLQSVVAEGFDEIFVVDSCSSDTTTDILNRMGVHFIALPENKGFGFCANIGFQHVASDYIFFLNPDAVVLLGVLQAIRLAFTQHPDAGIVGGLLVDRRGKVESDGFGGEITPVSIITRRILHNSLPTGVAPIAWVSGGALCISRSAFHAVEGFDPAFFLYWEDVDLCRRVRRAGYGVYIQPTAHLSHMRGASSTDMRTKTKLYDTSANRYFQKYYHPLIWRPLVFLRHLYRLIIPLVR